MVSRIIAALSGLLFGLGLLLSGMSNPAKVLGFLDVAGAWDPSLALVMVGAIGVAALGFSIKRPQHARSRIDGRVILGSLLFGAGWGLAGFCPGPALVSLASGALPVLMFVGAMLVGMFLFSLWDDRGF